MMLELTVRGRPYERGRQIGEAFAARLRTDAGASRAGWLPGWSLDRAEAAMGNIVFAMLRFVPHYVDELRGLADGAGISFRDAFLLNTHQAFGPLRAAFAPATPGAGRLDDDGAGCTNLAVAEGAAGPVLVKTVDGTRPPPNDAAGVAAAADRYVFLRIEPSAGEDAIGPYVMICAPGRLWPELGMNDAGLGGGQSSVPPVPGQRGHGVPVQWILRPALERCRTAAEAARVLATIPMSGKGMNMGFVDASGGAVGLEKSGERQEAFWPAAGPGEGWVAVTNAYQSPAMADALPSLHPANSAARLRAIRALFDGPLRDAERRTDDAAISLLRFHATDPDHESICQHGGGHDDTMYTYAGFLLWPQRREIWATPGPPCAHALERFDVRTGRVGAAALV